MRIGRAHIWQVPRLAAILWASTRCVSDVTCARSRIDDMYLLWRETWLGRVRVASVRGRVAGFILRRASRVHALYVAPDRRGVGVGKALLVDAKARTCLLDLWVLEENRRARAFYTRAGFSEAAWDLRGGGNDEGLPDIRMVWQNEEARA